MKTISIQQSDHLKAIAILMMVFLHLFNTLNYEGLFKPLLMIGDKPLVYYISLFCDACVPIFAFVTGYGHYVQYNKEPFLPDYYQKATKRLLHLYKHLWLIILVFPIGLGLLLQQTGFPGGWQKIIANVTAINPSYNGAWWYFTIYVMYILSAPYWTKLVQRLPVCLTVGGFLLLYILAFYVRVYVPNNQANIWMGWLQQYGILFLCTLLQFLLGVWAAQNNWPGRIGQLMARIQIPKKIWWLVLPALIMIHGWIPNFIIAPFTSLIFILVFVQFKMPKPLGTFLDFISPHATNIWLMHMFFYLVFFKDFIYSFTYVPLIYAVLLGVCIAFSMLMNVVLTWLKK